MTEYKMNQEATFDLGTLISYLLKKWKWFVVFGFGMAALFAVLSLNMPDKYTSEILLADADTSGSGMDGIAGKLGGLAGFAGINLDGGKDQKLIAVQILGSRKFLVDFVKDNELELKIFGVEKWDTENQRYIIDVSKYDEQNEKWLPRSNPKLTHYPTDAEIQKALTNMLEVEVDKTNKVTRIYFTHYNPLESQQWLTLLVEAINNQMRVADIEEKSKQIKYLETELDNVTNVGIRSVFFTLIEEQLKTVTLAKAREEYIFKIIDPATYPENRSSPKRALITILGGLVGGVLCFLIFATRFLFRANEHQ